jgi:hypothetical protein
MRPPVQIEKLESLMSAMGRMVKSPGRIYLAGGATALLHGSRDLTDVHAMLRSGLIRRDFLLQQFQRIEPQLIRYPALDPGSFRQAVEEFCNDLPGTSSNPLAP